ncbi:MAG: dihydroorotate dehydrogenase [Magnetococcales bacterium]|nr:dihydroorotate dehydrogenase [Magnetococcales bacterium]
MPVTESPLSIDLAGMRWRSPIVLLSGCVGFGEELLALDGFDFTSVGAICLKGTTLQARPGNAPPRLAETPCGLLNAIGLQNPGAQYVVETILPRLTDRLRSTPVPLIANISGATVEEYREVAAWFDNSPVAAIEVNISCPNVKQGGAAFGADLHAAAAVTRVVRQATSKPVIVKLSPNVTDIRAIARAVIEAGADALAVINTLMGMAVDLASRRPVLGNVQGGLSGPAVKPIALLKVWQVYQEAAPHRIPIIGQGGISSAEDALEFVVVGATAVGVGTALFRNPWLPEGIRSGMQAFLQQQRLHHLTELIGSLRTHD